MSIGRQRAGLVRPYAVTGGVAQPTRQTLDLAVLLMADPKRPSAGLEAEPYRVVELCRPGRLSVAEVSHHLGLPAAVTRIVVSRLVDSGHLIARAPVPAAEQRDAAFLERLLGGLRAL